MAHIKTFHVQGRITGHTTSLLLTGYIPEDPVIHGKSRPVFFFVLDPDPTCNNVYMLYVSSRATYLNQNQQIQVSTIYKVIENDGLYTKFMPRSRKKSFFFQWPGHRDTKTSMALLV